MPWKDPEVRRLKKRIYGREHPRKIALHRYTGIISRCGKREPYMDTKVSKEWLDDRTKFYDWFAAELKEIGLDPIKDREIVKDYHIDKDYGMQNIYSAENCILIPRRLNLIISKDNDHIEFRKDSKKFPYSVRMGDGKNKKLNIGVYSSREEAFELGVKVKAMVIRYWSNFYYRQNKISKRAFDTIERYVQVMLMKANPYKK